jgi:5-methylcytosine-specific restriction endonuclease McrA
MNAPAEYGKRMEKRLKNGDVGADGRVFWGYAPRCKNGEYWLSPEAYEKRRSKSRAARIAWMEKNRERLKAREKERYWANKEERLAKCSAWKSKNKEGIAEYHREYEKQWREANRKKVRAANARWRVKNKDRIAAYAMNRIARKKAAIPEGYDVAQIEPIYEACARVSQCVGVPHEVDHIIPLAAGGAHHHLNLQIIPRNLNARKSAKLDFPLPEPYARHGIAI